MYKSKGFAVCELIVSTLLVVFGVYTLANPSATLESAVIIYGLLAVLMGVLDIVVYVKLERRTGFGPIASLVTGIISVIAGAMILLEPLAGVLALTLLFPMWFICHCISRLMNLGLTRLVAGNAYYYFALVVNILGLILGIMMCFNPIVSVFTFSFIVGIYLILLGVHGIVLALSGLSRR